MRIIRYIALLACFAANTGAQFSDYPFIGVIYTGTGVLSYEEAGALSDKLGQELAKTRRYTVLDQSRIEDIVGGPDKLRACMDNGCMCAIGSRCALHSMIGREARREGGTWYIESRIVDVESCRGRRWFNAHVKGEVDELILIGMEITARGLSGNPQKKISESFRQEKEGNVLVPEGSPLRGVPELDLSAYDASIAISTIPTGAEVYLDDVLIGYANGGVLPVKSGEQTLRFVKADKSIGVTFLFETGRNAPRIVRFR